MSLAIIKKNSSKYLIKLSLYVKIIKPIVSGKVRDKNAPSNIRSSNIRVSLLGDDGEIPNKLKPRKYWIKPLTNANVYIKTITNVNFFNNFLLFEKI